MTSAMAATSSLFLCIIFLLASKGQTIQQCFDVCPSLRAVVDNGFVEYYENPIKNDTSLNESFYLSYTKAGFDCNDGYTKARRATKTCQPNGTWVGSAFICLGLCPQYNDTNLNMSAIDYDNLPVFIIKGCETVRIIGCRTVFGYEEGTTATFICPEGFISVGYTTNTTCTSSRTWSHVLSLDPCYPGPCPVLTLENGSVNYSQPLIDDPEGYPANTVAYFTCDAGYFLSGPSSITCNPNGQAWNQFPPICIEDICPDMP